MARRENFEQELARMERRLASWASSPTRRWEAFKGPGTWPRDQINRTWLGPGDRVGSGRVIDMMAQKPLTIRLLIRFPSGREEWWDHRDAQRRAWQVSQSPFPIIGTGHP